MSILDDGPKSASPLQIISSSLEINQGVIYDQGAEHNIGQMFVDVKAATPILPPAPIVIEIELDNERVTEFVSYLASTTNGWKIAWLEEVGAFLASVLLKNREATDRNAVLDEMQWLFERFVQSR